MNILRERLRRSIFSGVRFTCAVTLLVPLILTFFGLIVLSSASLSFCRGESFFYKQLLWFAVALVFFWIAALLDLDFFRKHANQIVIAFVALLVLVLVPGIGRCVNGSRRWIHIAGINLQISEFAKCALIVWLADRIDLAKMNNEMKSFLHGFFRPLALAGCVSGLILLEPDYGTAILIGGAVFSLLFLYGARILYLFFAGITALGTVSILISCNAVRMRRILAFMDIDSNKLCGAYQLWQGILGFVSGGLWGKGIGNGRQQLTYLPEAHTDFILPISGEEFGSIVIILSLALYLLLFVVCTVRAMKIKSTYRSAIVSGISLLTVYQVIINVGVVSGLLPTKGMVLPFMSYGGSSLISMYFMLGLLVNCFVSDHNECAGDECKSMP